MGPAATRPWPPSAGLGGGYPRVTPFLYPPFFSRAFKVDPRSRDYFVLYAKVMERLDPRLLEAPYYDLGCKLTPIASLQKVRTVACFALRAARKLTRRQRGALVPSEISWRYLERVYRELARRVELPGHPLWDELARAVEWVLEVRPMDARAVAVTDNTLRLLTQLAVLNLASRKG